MAKKYRKFVYKIVGILLIIALLGVVIFKDKIFDQYQLNRLNFLNPCSRYKEDSGYQVCNSYIAIHNGGLRGVGLGNSTQKYMYLPEAHTDFIFSIIVEELGLIIAVLIIIGYFVMLFAILKIAKKATNLRNSILAYGIFTYIFAHIIINLMGILGIIPLTGVPLPFLSYGGSYGICVVIAMAIIQRINIENRVEEKRNKIKNLR
jgi:cell division protein FtsW